MLNIQIYFIWIEWTQIQLIVIKDNEFRVHLTENEPAKLEWLDYSNGYNYIF